MDTLHPEQTFHGELLATVRRLRDQSAREWERNPLLAKTLEHIRDYVEVLLSVKFTPEREAIARAIWLDSLQNLDCPKLGEAFDIEADLRASLPELAGDDYIKMCLQREKQRLTLRKKDDPDHVWTDLFSEDELTKLLKSLESSSDEPQLRQSAIGHLAELYRQSHHGLRRHRAHAAQTAQYLRWLSPYFAGLLVVVATLLGSVEAFDPAAKDGRSWVDLIVFGVVMLAGAVGGLLGLMFRFRDERGRIRDLLSDLDIRWVQPLISAAMALAVVLIVKSELITVAGFTGGKVLPLAALGFVAGFSEPAFFGIVGRIVAATAPGPSQGTQT